MKRTSGPDRLHDANEFERLHVQLSRRIDAVLALHPGQLVPHLHHLVAQVEADFRHEEALMDSFDCADRALHREQHARTLAGLHHAAASLDQGDPAPAIEALAALRQWLVFHAATQDRHLQRQLQRSTPCSHTQR
ncbi:bacteriohemerythrin [Pseudoduganella sp. OTU4001]|uniref:bacteriohemerythrin n=1 Tax=Pseudoduganella sp. OTU4001 TaxID=3043854 RepID=UPI00313DBCB7